jgi:transposase InsO family protein
VRACQGIVARVKPLTLRDVDRALWKWGQLNAPRYRAQVEAAGRRSPELGREMDRMYADSAVLLKPSAGALRAWTVLPRAQVLLR